MRGKTRGEARDELIKSGITGDRLNLIIPHKVRLELTNQLRNGVVDHCYQASCCMYVVSASILTQLVCRIGTQMFFT